MPDALPPSSPSSTTTIVVEQQSNGLGTASFVLSIISFFTPLLLGGIILVFLGFILGAFGMRKKPKGLAIAGFILSIVSLFASPSFWLYLASLGNR